MAAAKRGAAAAMKLFYKKLRSPPFSMAATKRGAAAMKLFYEKLRSAFLLPCSSLMGLMVSFKLTKLIYRQRGIEELVKKRMEKNQKKIEAGSGDEKNDGVKKPTVTMNPVEMMSTFVVLQDIVDSVVKDTSTVHSIRKETVENAASILWKIAMGADIREQKGDISSILKELRFGNAKVRAIAAKLNAVDVKLETLMGNFNILIPHPNPLYYCCSTSSNLIHCTTTPNLIHYTTTTTTTPPT
ncbi:hypothetical protein HYC85_000447 [Camellia sinensis]|uniref:Uncharacterized protein n=1 Tax=Camellia sinensis TaxID=4442 RepID=A0A7J7I558_CAMSI|nr:hypothetical protein HYC85_000447 [Camellia sinensis]